MIIEILLIAAGLYLGCGLLFAISFVLAGAGRIDPHAVNGSRGFRVLILPGTIFFWPLLARRWLKGVHEPPEENNPHRQAARSSNSRHRRPPASQSFSDISHSPALSPEAEPSRKAPL